MTNLFIADKYLVIKENEEHPVTNGMVEMLDEMLNDHGIGHFFSLPEAQEDGFAADDEVLNLYYEEKQKLELTLVYALWLKEVRQLDDKKIWCALKKSASHYLED